ncbi:hypothetical protein POTOM_001095 [Populus tomentosa]|uniref:NB-ARC domain-containing protein n=1 Tax=Populus tomentosa TaxID=118781 RepID=A0A8X8IY91_POPTO|nr:hypothetical protein POTOM_001095 [Populus tomentosa]
MIQQLFRVHRKPDPKGVDNMNYNKLRSVIHEFLRQKKYLIVLDDVWHTSDWRAFQHALPNSICGSRILVTTRNTEVASTSCMDSPDKVYPLNPLSQEESWTLFCKKIFQDNPCPPHLKNVSETILGRCAGLPLAIVAISGVLATKDKSKTEEWEMVHLSLGAGLEENDMLMSARKILSLSYNDLPSYLKSCLLYLSIFPVGNRLWIAEGFVKGKEGMTVEEVAQDYLNELMKRSLVQVAIAHNLYLDISNPESQHSIPPPSDHQQPLNLTPQQQQDNSNIAPHPMVTRSQHALHQAAQPPCSDASADEFVPNSSTSAPRTMTTRSQHGIIKPNPKYALTFVIFTGIPREPRSCIAVKHIFFIYCIPCSISSLTSDGRVKMCCVRDLLRKIMITKAKDQDFVVIAKEEGTIWPEKVCRVSVVGQQLTTGFRRGEIQIKGSS